MSIREWFNSEPVNQFRQQLLGDKEISVCQRCYSEEKLGAISKRIKGNLKSAIFMQAFDPSFEQSPGHKHFSNAEYTGFPIDLHIDLGNHCNLACKMCGAKSSSKIAAQEVKWGIKSSKNLIGTNWTADQKVWDSFKQQLLEIPKLSNVHFMGGETLLSDRIEDLVDFLTEHNRFDVGLSFVTNGTIYRPNLIKKMSRFKRTGIEISIETTTSHNDYIRQGSNTVEILDTIKKYNSLCNGTTVDVTIRPAISTLSIGTFWTLLEFCLKEKMVMKPNWCISPDFFNPVILPKKIKDQYLIQYKKIAQSLEHLDINKSFNASDHHNADYIVKHWCNACISSLNDPQPNNADELLEKMIQHCIKWDKVYQFSLIDLYPEFAELNEKYGLRISS